MTTEWPASFGEYALHKHGEKYAFYTHQCGSHGLFNAIDVQILCGVGNPEIQVVEARHLSGNSWGSHFKLDDLRSCNWTRTRTDYFANIGCFLSGNLMTNSELSAIEKLASDAMKGGAA